MYLSSGGTRKTKRVKTAINEAACRGIYRLSAEAGCHDLEVIYGATVSYLSQLIEQAEVTVALTPSRGASDHDCDASGRGYNLLKIANQVDSNASFIRNLHCITASLREAQHAGASSAILPREFQDLSNGHHGAVVWINLPTAPQSTPDLETFLASLSLPKDALRFVLIDVRFSAVDGPPYISCSSNNLEDGCIGSFVDGLVSFLDSVVTHPQLSLVAHELVSRSERDEVLLRWNDTKSPYPQLCVHELFERQVRSTPARTAVEFKGRALTYAELNGLSNRLARRIVGGRSSPKRQRSGKFLAGICVERSLEMVVGLLGALKAGYAYVPIDPSYPDERVALLVEDAGLDIVLTQEHLRGKFASFSGSIFFLEDELSGPIGETEKHSVEDISTEHVIVTPADPAAVLYTSGSTGTPKGVFITHRGIVSRIHWMCSTFPFTEDEVAGHIAQLPFVRALWELFVPLSRGIKVIVIDLDTTKDPQKLSQCIGQHKITRLVTAPSLAQTLVSSCHQPGSGLHALKHWFIGGESLHCRTAAEIRRALPNTSICNLYGATEVHSFASYYPVNGEACEGARVPIGRAIGNTSLLALDRHKRILPIGVHGEVCVLGDGIADGYLNRPELTEAKFSDHHFTDVWSSRLYRTGDIGYYQPDRNMMFVSRRDHQVKIRGMRIELGEVETALLAHKDVDKAVVVSHEFGPSDSRLVAYVVPRLWKGNPEAGEWKRRFTYLLRRFLGHKLPSYMIPAYFVILGRLPLNAYGKVLRNELPDPDLSSTGSIGYHPPRTETEKVVCKIWEEVLGIDKVGVLDSFFDLGGHSLLAGRIKARVDDAFSIDLPVTDVLQGSTVSALAQAIANLAMRSSDLPSLTRTVDCSPAPLTEEIRCFERLLDQSSVLIHFCVRVHGEVDVRALRDSLVYLIGRHDALRMTFKRTNNGTCMLPSSAVQVDFRVINICNALCPTADTGASETEMLRTEIRGLLSTPSDVASGCLTRWALIHLSRVESVLVGVINHAAVDAPSMVILRRELKVAYEAYCKGRQPNLPPLAFSYLDYAHWQERYRSTASYVIGKEIQKSRSQKVHAEVKRMAIRAEPGTRNHCCRLYNIDGQTRLETADFCTGLGITEGVLYVVAFHLAVHGSFDQEDILICMPASHRKFVELQNVVGLFAYPIHIRSVLSNDMPLIELIAGTRMRVLEAQNTGFIYLDLGETPRHDFEIHYRNFPGDMRWELFNLDLEPMNYLERAEIEGRQLTDEKNSKIMLRVDKQESDDAIYLLGSQMVFSDASFEAFNECFMFALRGLTRVPDLSISVADFLKLRCPQPMRLATAN